MKRIYLPVFLLLALSSIVQPAMAQHEFTLGTGIKSMYQLAENNFFLGDNLKHYKTTGAWGLSWRYYLGKRFSLGLNATVEHVGDRPFAPANKNSELYSFYTMAPEVTYSYLARQTGAINIRLYWLAAWGVTLVNEAGNNVAKHSAFYPLGLQLTPIGISVGRALAGYAEAGFGYRGAINAGICYRPGQAGN